MEPVAPKKRPITNKCLLTCIIDDKLGLPIIPEVQTFVYSIPTDIEFETNQKD